MNESVKVVECDSWTMVRNPEDRQSVACDDSDQQHVPQLPAKMKINSPRFSLRKGDTNSIDSQSNAAQESNFKMNKNVELDYLMMRLNNLASMTHFADLYTDSVSVFFDLISVFE